MSPSRSLILVAVAATLLCQGGIAGASNARARESAGFQTSRTFHLGAGRVTRAFTFRERGGFILLNRLSVPHGVRAFVDAQIPGIAGARVQSWLNKNQPALSCRRRGEFDVCIQGEEWCPMPATAWHFRLVKLSGPAGAIRFDYFVGPPKRR